MHLSPPVALRLQPRIIYTRVNGIIRLDDTQVIGFIEFDYICVDPVHPNGLIWFDHTFANDSGAFMWKSSAV